MQADTPDDYVVATGQLHTVRNFVERAFAAVGLEYQKYVQVDPRFFRPAEAVPLCGNPAKIARALDWRPVRSLDQIISEMVAYELRLHGKAPQLRESLT